MDRMTFQQYQGLLLRWSPNWRGNANKLLPWWHFTQHRDDVTRPVDYYYERADGIGKVQVPIIDGKIAAVSALAQMVRFDMESPMPRPDRMAGQTWWDSGANEEWTSTVARGGGDSSLFFMLLYGPTPWGINVPWIDPSLLPAEIVAMAAPPVTPEVE